MRLPRSKLTDQQFKRLLEHFVAGTPARTAAELVRVNRNSARLFYHRLRELIAERLSASSPFRGPIAVEDIGPQAIHQDRPSRTGAAWAPVFVLRGNGRKVYTAMVRSTGHAAQSQAQKPRMQIDSIVYVEMSEARNVLDVSRFHHQRIPQTAGSVHGQIRINSIENFWSQSKRHLRRYNGVPRHHFHLFLMECEWRFNFGQPGQLFKTLKSWVKMKSQTALSMPGRRISRATPEAEGKSVAARRRNRGVASVSRNSMT
jgi:transposase